MYEVFQDPWEEDAQGMSQQDRQRAGGTGGFLGGLLSQYFRGGALSQIGAGGAPAGDVGTTGVGPTGEGIFQQGSYTLTPEATGFMEFLKALLGTSKRSPSGPWGAYGG